ncbi:MAG: alpha/beta fold hydrolase [Hyphomicrobiaceae bacterium]|nr:alpha/beta fold hydrolase [Hyphomicrobiaceae bacterium]
MRRLANAVALVVLVAAFFGGLVVAAWMAWPVQKEPYRGVTLPHDVHIVTSRSWFRVSLFSLETFDAFMRRPVELKWLVRGGSGIVLDRNRPALQPGRAIVLIHGYNAPESKVGSYFGHITGMLRATFGPDAALIVYDWPSTARHWEELTPGERQVVLDPGGDTLRRRASPTTPIDYEARAYASDKEAALGHGADGLVRLLRELTVRESRRVTVVAHSMGGLVMLEALKRLSDDVPPIDRIVMLAPDLPADVLGGQGLARALRRVRSLVVLHSRVDEALKISRVANLGPRLGLDGYLGKEPLPANVIMKDVTAELGTGAGIHGRYLEPAGALAIGLADVVAGH